MSTGTGITEAIAAAVMAYITARQEIEEQAERARQRAERERQRAQEKQQREAERAEREAERRALEYEKRWDVKTRRRIDAAKQEARHRFTGPTAQVVCEHLDARGAYLSEIAEGSLHGVSRGVIEDEIQGWERDLAALGACDRGLLPTDDQRVARAQEHVAKVVETAGAVAPAPVDYVSLSERAKAGVEEIKGLADRAPRSEAEMPPSGTASAEIAALMEALEARRAAPAVAQKMSSAATPSRASRAPRVTQPKKTTTTMEMEF